MPLPPPQTTPGVDPFLQRIIEMVFAAGGGALVTLVAFRTKIAMMNRDITDARAEARDAKSLATDLASTVQRLLDSRMETLTEDLHRQFDPINQRLVMLDRRMYEMLLIVVDFARATGNDKRLSNGLMRMLADEPSPRRESEDDHQ